jgi:hypothetical protein
MEAAGTRRLRGAGKMGEQVGKEPESTEVTLCSPVAIKLGNLEPAANRVSSCRVDEMLYDASAVCSAPRVGVPVLDLAVPREAPDALTVNLVSQE